MESGMNLSLEGRSCFQTELLGNWDGLRVDAEEEQELKRTRIYRVLHLSIKEDTQIITVFR